MPALCWPAVPLASGMSKYSRHGISPKLESSGDSSLGDMARALGWVDGRQLTLPVAAERVAAASLFRSPGRSQALGKAREQLSKEGP